MVEGCWEVWALAKATAWRVLFSKRMVLLLLVEAMPLWSLLSPIGSFVPELGYRVGPWLFTFVVGDPVCQAFFSFGVLFLLADAPFVSSDEAFVLVRAGRLRWALSRVLAIMLIVAMYYGALLVLSWLFVAPWMTFAVDGWGVAITTLTETDAAQSVGITLAFDSAVVGALAPTTALLLTLGFEVVSGVLLGLCIAAVNAFTGSRAGLAPAAFIVLFDLLVLNVLPHTAFLVSPVSHARIHLLNFAGTSATLPSPTDALLFDVSAIAVMGLLAIWAMRRIDLGSQMQNQ